MKLWHFFIISLILTILFTGCPLSRLNPILGHTVFKKKLSRSEQAIEYERIRATLNTDPNKFKAVYDDKK